MIIEKLRTNHLENPLGYRMDKLSLSWVVREAAGSFTAKTRVLIALDGAMTQIVHDSEERADISSVDYAPDLTVTPGTRYYWQVQVWDDADDSAKSEVAFFETPIALTASWIRAPFDKQIQPILRRTFCAEKEVARARLYICGLGLYEAYLNGEKVGDEYLTPYYNDYNLWLQYQTFDVTAQIRAGGNCLGVMLGDGWYKGRFGDVANMRELYGDDCRLCCELHMTFEDGTTQIVTTDDAWQCAPSAILESSIYDGEIYDSRKEILHWADSCCEDPSFVPAVLCDDAHMPLTPRMSLPVKIMERIRPIELIRTPAGELVLDFGQEFTGWVEFFCREPAETEVFFQYGEILQNGCFYNNNLRTAKAEYHYISNGIPRMVRPHFTFYGFRYVKIQGITSVDLDDFSGCVLYSQMDRTGSIETSNAKVNRLFQNALWGQKSNFLDVPTDCPQRDERMGWTGDAQIFSATASLNLYTPAFFAKYLYDMKLEQETLDGSVPNVVPDVAKQIHSIMRRTGTLDPNMLISDHGSCAWGDAATVIPWTVYMAFGDKVLLSSQYENMKSWTDYIRKVDIERCGGRYLWTDGFHFADWLALDNFHSGSCFGATDPYFVASAYYYYAASLTARAAKALEKLDDAAYYTELAAHIKTAFLAEYYTRTGRLAQQTQTALVLVLWLDLIPEGARQRQIDTLLKMLREEKMHLTTGFVGTPLLCPVLTANGHAEAAYTLLLNEDYPSWLYEINMGATTIWERWNSVLPDGSIGDTSMNSLNHYSYGSIVEWMYRYMCGLNAIVPGYKEFVIHPYTDPRFDWVQMSYDSAHGMIRSAWKKQSSGILYTVEVPYDTEATFILPHDAKRMTVNDTVIQPSQHLRLTKGIYQIYVES